MRYRPDIDGLRGVSIISVVLFHAHAPGFSGGFVGVDVFFVISGFLITTIIRDELERGDFRLVDFYDRRIRRIFPAFAAVCLFCLAAGLVVSMPEDLKNFGKSLASSAFFVSNLYFHSQAGYFDSEALTKPLLHSWSLSVEEQFYLIWPCLMIALWRFVPGARRLPLILTGLAASLLYAEWLIGRGNQSAAFYLLPSRAWELLAGASLALLLPGLRIGPRIAELLGIVGLGLIAGAVVGLSEGRDFPGLNAVFPCLGAVLLIAAGSAHASLATRLLSMRGLVLVGVISYSLYLWHWPLFSYWQLTFDRPPGVAETCALIAASLLAATLSYRYIEQPFRRRAVIPRLRRTFIAGFGVMAAFIAAGGGLSASKGLPARFDAGIVADIFAAAGHQENRQCGINDTFDVLNRSKCMIGMSRNSPGADFVLMGDSHAMHFAPAFDIALKKYGLSGRLITNSGCIPLPGVKVFRGHREEKKCAKFLVDLDKFLSQSGSKLVVLAARWERYSADTPRQEDSVHLVEDTGNSVGGASSKVVLERALNAFVGKLEANGKQVLLMGQIPPYQVAPKHCVARARYYKADPSICNGSMSDIRKRIEFSNALFLRVAARSKGVHAYLPSQTLCNDLRCSLFLNDVFLYSDKNHLNSAGSEQFAAPLEAVLAGILGQAAPVVTSDLQAPPVKQP